MEYSTDTLVQDEYKTSGHHTVTFNGTAQIDRDIKKFTNPSLLLDGNSDYLSIADSDDWNIVESSLDNWTISFFVKHNDHAGTEYYICQREDSQHHWFVRHEDGAGLRFYAFDGESEVVTTNESGEITDTNWHHITAIKVGNIIGVYKDGIQYCFGTFLKYTTFEAPLLIGQLGTGNYFDGNIAEVYISHSNIFGANPNADKTDTISVPTAPLQSDTNTKLNLHFDGQDGATSTLDWSRLEPVSESSIKQQGSYSMKIFSKQTDSLNSTLTKDLYKDQIPKMTSNTTPEGEASASTEYSATYKAWKAMNDTNIDVSDCWVSSTTPTVGSPQWLQYESIISRVIMGYSITTRNDSNTASPKDWTLQGSNNGSDWTILDTQTNQFPTNPSNTKQYYNFSNEVSYIYYRLNITARNGGNAYVAIGEFELCDGVIDLTGKNTIKLDVRASRTGSNFKIGFHDVGGTTTEQAITINSADTWETKEIDISEVSDENKDEIDKIIITITNADADNIIYIDNIRVDSANIILISQNTTAEAQPDNVRIIIFQEDIDSITVNTDLKSYVSRDGGTTYSQVTLSDEGDWISGKRIIAGTVDISGQPAGTTMKWKATTHNNKNLNLHGVGLIWG